jgi:hypothetical protein
MRSLTRLIAELGRPRETGSARDALDAVEEVEPGVVCITSDRFRRLGPSEARTELLRLASERAARVEVRVPIENDGTYIARALVDGPRRLLRRLGRDVADPGDRFGDGDLLHRYFDEEALLREIERAGLALVDRRGETFVLERARSASSASRELPSPFAVEVGRVVRALAWAERARAHDPPEKAVRAMRNLGAHAPCRGPIGRARLRRAIGWIDVLHPSGPSCYRRTLLELSLDAKAARETIVFGLNVGRTGHVAFKDTEDRTFDVAYEIEG